MIANVTQALAIRLQLSTRIHNFHTASPQHITRTHQHGIADFFCDCHCLLYPVRSPVRRSGHLGLFKNLAEFASVLSIVNRLWSSAQNWHSCISEALGKAQRGLTSQLDNDPLDGTCRAFCFIYGHDILKRQGLEIESICRVIVGRDGLRIAVHHHCLIGLFEGEGSMHTGIIEFDSLANAVGAGSQNNHRFAVPRRYLGFRIET